MLSTRQACLQASSTSSISLKKKTNNKLQSKTALIKSGDQKDPIVYRLIKEPESDYSDVKASGAPFVSPEFGKKKAAH